MSLSILSAIQLINNVYNSQDIHYVDWISPLIKLITYCYVSALIWFSRKKAIQSPGILFLFWLFLSVGSILSYRSIFIDLMDAVSN